jgi:hypothetical protein
LFIPAVIVRSTAAGLIVLLLQAVDISQSSTPNAILTPDDIL